MSEAAFAQAHQAKQAGVDGAIDKCWLLTTLHRDWTSRSSQTSVTDPSNGVPSSVSPLIAARDAAELSSEIVLKTLHAMRLDRRLILSLFYFEQLGHVEIARILDLPESVALSRFAEAKIEFRQQLERQRTTVRPALTMPVHAEGGLSG